MESVILMIFVKWSLICIIPSGQKIKDVSSEYGVSDVTIYSWIKKLTSVWLEDDSIITLENYAKLQKQMQKLMNEILKKSLSNSQKK